MLSVGTCKKFMNNQDIPVLRAHETSLKELHGLPGRHLAVAFEELSQGFAQRPAEGYLQGILVPRIDLDPFCI